MAKRAFLGARVSSNGQGDNTSLDAQILAMRNYCEQMGYVIVEEMRETHTGVDSERPSLQRVRELARAKQIDVMVVYSIDRFMRDFTKAVITESELSKLGVTVEYLNLPESEGAGYRITKSILQILAEEEKRTIVDRMLRGKYNSVRKGKIIIASPPLGYDFNEEHDNFVINEFEASIIRKIFDLCVAGFSTYKIAAQLSEEKLPTRDDLHPGLCNNRVRHYAEWSNSSVRRILHNKTYAGLYTMNGVETASMDVPAIVSTDVFNEAQKKLADRKVTHKGCTKYKGLLQGRFTCGYCGHAIGIYTNVVGNTRYSYYRCAGKVNSKRNASYISCESPNLNAEKTDDIILNWLYNDLPDRLTLLEKYRQIMLEFRTSREDETRIVTIYELLEKCESRKKREKELFRNGFSTMEELRDSIARIDNEMFSLENELSKVKDKQKKLPSIEEFDYYICSLQETIAEVRQSKDFSKLLWLLETLDVQAVLHNDDGDVFLEVDALLLGTTILDVLDTSSSLPPHSKQTPHAHDHEEYPINQAHLSQDFGDTRLMLIFPKSDDRLLKKVGAQRPPPAQSQESLDTQRSPQTDQRKRNKVSPHSTPSLKMANGEYAIAIVMVRDCVPFSPVRWPRRKPVLSSHADRCGRGPRRAGGPVRRKRGSSSGSR